jgi:hypothetical protein
MTFPQALRSKKPWRSFRFELYLQKKECMGDYWVLLGVVSMTLYQIFKTQRLVVTEIERIKVKEEKL